MGQVHEFLGLKVGVVLGGMDNDERTGIVLTANSICSTQAYSLKDPWKGIFPRR